MKKQNQKFAFSLIELSIVILVVGILIIGISKGSKILKESKLKMAQSLTINSPVASIDGIVLWVETTLDKSFSSDEVTDTALGAVGTLSTWIDINPQVTNMNNAIQSDSANKPRYRTNVFNGLPAVNFDGISDHLTYNGDSLVNTDYTIFFVDQRRDRDTNPILGGTGSGVNKNLTVGSTHVDLVDYYMISRGGGGTFLGAVVPSYTSPIPRISTYRVSSVADGPPLTWFGINYSLNGVPQELKHPPGAGSLVTSVVMRSHLSSYEGSAIGRHTTQYCNCDIGEIIIFSRYLTETEKEDVEKYLKNKWGIR